MTVLYVVNEFGHCFVPIDNFANQISSPTEVAQIGQRLARNPNVTRAKFSNGVRVRLLPSIVEIISISDHFCLSHPYQVVGTDKATPFYKRAISDDTLQQLDTCVAVDFSHSSFSEEAFVAFMEPLSAQASSITEWSFLWVSLGDLAALSLANVLRAKREGGRGACAISMDFTRIDIEREEGVVALAVEVAQTRNQGGLLGGTLGLLDVRTKSKSFEGYK